MTSGTAQTSMFGDLDEVTGELGRGRNSTYKAINLLRRWLLPLVVLAVIWEMVVYLGGLNRQLFPPLQTVLQTFWNMLLNGVLIQNSVSTFWRIFLGWVIASVLGVALGFAMYRSVFVQELLLPMIGILLPIPSIALIPLFILWFGLGSTPIVVLIVFSAVLPTMLSTWAGMRGVNPVLIKAAQTMNVRGLTLFRKVVLPGAVAAVMSGLRLGLAQAWRAAIAGEMIAGIAKGLGVMIFSAQQYVQTDVMLATLLVIGPMGLLLEKVLFQAVERATIERWGMTRRG